MMSGIAHLARFGMPAESRYLIDYRDSYDCLMFNANSLAHMPGAVARLVSQGTVKPYIVDPQTHAFQHDPVHLMKKTDDGDYILKRSIDRLADAYGDLIRRKAGRKAVVPSDFTLDVVTNLVESVVRFQLETIPAREVSEENKDYLQWMSLDVTAPKAVVAPYFYMDARTCEQWLPVNIDLARLTGEVLREVDVPMLVEMVLDRDILLDSGVIQTLASAYGDIACEGIVLWIDALSEQEAPGRLLDGMVTLLKHLRGKKLKIFNLYGGYFSILLTAQSFGGLLTGVCHGMEYGEDRSVVPVGGGIPMAKYYLPSLHQRLRFGDAARLLFERGWLADADTFHQQVCDCQTCRTTLAGDTRNFSLFGAGNPVSFRRGGNAVTLMYPTAETKDHCLRHYLSRKQIEYERASAESSDSLLADLTGAADDLEGDVGIEGVSHLRTWRDVLSPLS